MRWKGHSLLNQSDPNFKHWLCHLPAAWPQMLGKGDTNLTSEGCRVGNSVLSWLSIQAPKLSSCIHCLALPLFVLHPWKSYLTLQDSTASSCKIGITTVTHPNRVVVQDETLLKGLAQCSAHARCAVHVHYWIIDR